MLFYKITDIWLLISKYGAISLDAASFTKWIAFTLILDLHGVIPLEGFPMKYIDYSAVFVTFQCY